MQKTYPKVQRTGETVPSPEIHYYMRFLCVNECPHRQWAKNAQGLEICPFCGKVGKKVIEMRICPDLHWRRGEDGMPIWEEKK